MDQELNPSINSNLPVNEEKVNHQVLIGEIRKMRGQSLQEKEKILDVIAEILGYQDSSDGMVDEEQELPGIAPNSNKSVLPQEAQSQILDKNGKKVLQVSAQGKKFIIRGYKADLPRGSTVIRYRLTVNGIDEPVSGLDTKGQKFGHTKDQIIKKLQTYLGQGAQKPLQDFVQYDATFYTPTQQG